MDGLAVPAAEGSAALVLLQNGSKFLGIVF